MTIFPEYRLRCDQCGTISMLTGLSPREMWKQAKGNQWVRHLGNDFCPSCAGINPEYWDAEF